MDLAAGEGRVEPYNYAPPGAAVGPEMGMATGVGLAAGGAARRAGTATGPPTSAPSAYSQPSQYGSGSSDAGVGAGPSMHGHSQAHSQDPYAAYAAYSSDDGTSPRSSQFPGGVGGFYVPPPSHHSQPSPGPSLPSATTSSGTGALPSTKELESRGLRVRNENHEVVQHTDGGRVRANEDGEEAEVGREIPPSYDSIRD